MINKIKLNDIIEEEINKSFGTYTSNGTWDDLSFNTEELLKINNFMIKDREAYENKVKEFCKKLRPCPLIILMYGSMELTFGVLPNRIKFKEMKLDLPVKKYSYSYPFYSFFY